MDDYLKNFNTGFLEDVTLKNSTRDLSQYENSILCIHVKKNAGKETQIHTLKPNNIN